MVCMNEYVYMYIRIYVYMYICVYKCIYVYIYKYMHYVLTHFIFTAFAKHRCLTAVVKARHLKSVALSDLKSRPRAPGGVSPSLNEVIVLDLKRAFGLRNSSLPHNVGDECLGLVAVSLRLRITELASRFRVEDLMFGTSFLGMYSKPLYCPDSSFRVHGMGFRVRTLSVRTS